MAQGWVSIMKTPKTPDKISPTKFSKFLPEYLSYVERIQKTLYYGRLPLTDRPSLPFTSLCVDKFSGACRRGGLEVLDIRTAATLSYHACPTPASLVIALLYLERLSPDYLANTPPSRVFLIAMMVASKYLYDDGEEDEVFNDEWATSAAITLHDLNQAEREFLQAIDWNLFVDGDSFLRAFERVEAEVAWREGVHRGHFTYTDLAALAHSLALTTSCSAFLNLVSHVVAVCMVGYTAAVVSVVAGTVLAQECCQQVSSAISHFTYDATTPNDSLTLCPGTQLADSPLNIVTDSVNSLPDTVDGLLESEEVNTTILQSLPSRAITTLTTSILLAMSTPTLNKPGHPRDTSGTRRDDSDACSDTGHPDSWSDGEPGSTCQGKAVCDPSDLRMSFTTGAYWPPSSLSWSPGGIVLNPGLPQDLPSLGDLVTEQKENWVYSNPWVLPWLTWHTAPVYSTIHNFSGIGAPNISGFSGREDGWLEEWIGWMAWTVVSALADITPHHVNQPSLLSPPVLSRVTVAHSGLNPVPLMI